MGILDWLIMVLPDHVSPKEPQNNEGTAKRVLENYQKGAKEAKELGEAKEEAKKRDATSKTASFDAWLATQCSEPPNVEHSPAVKDFLIYPDLPEPTNDYEPN